MTLSKAPIVKRATWYSINLTPPMSLLVGVRVPLSLWGRYLYGGEAFRVDQTSELVRRGRIIAAEQLKAAGI